MITARLTTRTLAISSVIKRLMQDFAGNYKNGTIVEALAFIYLYVPIIIFLCTWIKPLFAIIPIALIFLFFCSLVKGIAIPKRIPFWSIAPYFIFVTFIFALSYLWGRVSDLDGHAAQVSDFYKHNAILRSLIQEQWPVYFNFGEQGKGTLCYYFAYYLVPAIAGKLRSFNAATTTMLGLSALGITLTVMLLYESNKCRTSLALLLIFANIFLFSTFAQPFKELYAHIFPDDGYINSIHWFSKAFRIHYGASITLLRWVAPQFVPTLVSSALLWKKRGSYLFYPFIAMPLILYSTFAFVGITMLMFLSFFFDFSKHEYKLQEYISEKDIIRVILRGGA